jgi:steroid delta-isomerase-like uncharacterized protein
MSPEENKQLVRTFFQRAFVDHDIDAAAELVASNYALHDPTRPNFAGGVAAFKTAQRIYEDAIANHSFTVDDQLAEGDKVVTRWTVTGAQRADLPGVPNRGKGFQVGGITISRIQGDRIAEEWQFWDDAGLRRQLSSP